MLLCQFVWKCFIGVFVVEYVLLEYLSDLIQLIPIFPGFLRLLLLIANHLHILNQILLPLILDHHTLILDHILFPLILDSHMLFPLIFVTHLCIRPSLIHY